MPKIPQIDPGGNVASRALPSVPQQGVDSTAFGSIRARQLQAVGAGMGRIGDAFSELEQREDEDAARRAFSSFNDRVRSLLHAPDTGILNQRGYAARDATTRGRKGIEDALLKTEATLKTTHQRRTYRALTESLRSSSLNQLVQHEAAQLEAAEVEGLNAIRTGSVEDAAAARGDIGVITEAGLRGVDAIRAVAARQGWSKAQIDQAVEDHASSVHVAVIASMIDSDNAFAREYYRDNKGDINGDKQASIEQSLKTADVRQRAQSSTDKIIALNGPMELTKNLKAARAIADPDVRDDAVSRVKARYIEAKTVKDELDSERVKQAWSVLVSADVKTTDHIPAEVWDQLPAAVRKEMKQYVESEHMDPTGIGDDFEVMDMYALANSMDPTERRKFMEMNLREKTLTFGFDKTTKLIALQDQMRRGIVAGKTPEQQRYALASSFVDEVAPSISGLSTTGEKGSALLAAQGARRQLQSTLVSLIAARQMEHPETPVTEEEVRQIGAKLVLQGRRRVPFAYDPEVMYFQYLQAIDSGDSVSDQTFYVPIDEIPPADVERARNFLRAQGRQADDASVERVYTQFKVNGSVQ